MGRVIGGIVLGYLVMAALVFGAFSLAYLAMSADRAFRPDSFEVTGTWLVTSTVLSLAAAVVGGWLAAAVGRSPHAPRFLAVVVVVLGVILAIPTLNAPRNEERRSGEVGNIEAMMKAQQPPAVSILNPVIGGVGVMLGGRLRRPRESGGPGAGA